MPGNTLAPTTSYHQPLLPVEILIFESSLARKILLYLGIEPGNLPFRLARVRRTCSSG
jgi:hypothetical protein